MRTCSDNMQFAKIQEKIIPAFEHAHGPGYQALIMVDNSQGHSAYLADALLVSQMNVHPGSKQARMHDGWFFHDGSKVTQPMVYPADHPTNPNDAKGIKAVLVECGLYMDRLRGKCKKCTLDTCCGKRILELQPDFRQQKITCARGNWSRRSPLYSSAEVPLQVELHWIFLGAVKKYLRDNCDYTFDTFEGEHAESLEVVKLQTIQRWEHRMYQWMDAYRAGMGTTDASETGEDVRLHKVQITQAYSENVAHTFNQ